MIIYKATNIINGKIYIGLTRISLKKRKTGHINKSTYSNSYFHRAINKYGRDNFVWEILDQSAKNYNELCCLEKHYIATLKPQYNMSEGGENSVKRVLTEEHKRKIGLSGKGRIVTLETRNKIRAGLKGKKLSQEAKDKIKQAFINKKLGKYVNN